MRMFRLAIAFALLSCAQKSPTSAPTPASTIVYHTGGYTDRGVVAVAEDGSHGAITLSQPGIKTQFVTALPAHRALLAEYNADQSIARLVSIATDATDRRVVAELPPAAYQNAFRVLPAGDALVVALVANGQEGPADIFVIRGGAALQVAQGAQLVAADSYRVAYLAGGNLSSVAFDGSTILALGGGDGQDRIAEVGRGRILMTIHGGDVRLVDLFGRATTIATPETETAFGLTPQDRIVFTRGSAVVSSASDGSDERVVNADATPVAIVADGRVVVRTSTGALVADGVVIDPHVDSARSLQVAGSMAVYVAGDAGSSEIRSAHMDGSGVVTIYVQDLAQLSISALTSDGRVVFTVPNVGDPDQVSGGFLFSARLDGSDVSRIGTHVATATGASIPIDQDFEAVTPSGRLVFEVEYKTGGVASQIAVGAAASTSAQQISQAPGARFAGLVP
jgi:hypothetical protein